MKKEFSLRKIEENKDLSYEHLNTTPIEIPLGHEAPITYNQALARILYSSGQLSKSDYYSMMGYTYDSSDDDFESDVDTFEDDDLDVEDFHQNLSLAQYDTLPYRSFTPPIVQNKEGSGATSAPVNSAQSSQFVEARGAEGAEPVSGSSASADTNSTSNT